MGRRVVGLHDHDTSKRRRFGRIRRRGHLGQLTLGRWHLGRRFRQTASCRCERGWRRVLPNRPRAHQRHHGSKPRAADYGRRAHDPAGERHMMIISEPKTMLLAWFKAKTGIIVKPEECSALAVINADHKILSGLLFSNWQGRDIEISVAPRPVPRALLRAAYLYVVGQ